MSSTCAIIAHWKTPEDTLACLERLWVMDPGPDRIVVADNGSGDGSGERLLARARERLGPSQTVAAGPAEPVEPRSRGEVHVEGNPSAHTLQVRPPSPQRGAPGVQPSPVPGARIPAFTLLTLAENRGYAGAVNAAVRLAMAQGAPDFFLILNSDAMAHQNALTAFLACAAARPDVGIFGATILKGQAGSAPEVLECAGGCRYLHWATMTRPNLAGLDLIAALKREEPLIDYVHGACMFARREVFDTVGLFDERFFLFCEELDFCLRATSLGFGLGWCREARVVHAGGASLKAGFPDARERKLVANYHENLGALMIARQWAGAAFPLAVSWRFFGKLAVLAARRETYLAAALFAACKRFFFGGAGPSAPR